MKVLSLFVIGCTLGCKYSRWSMLKPKWVASPANSIMVKTQNNPCRVLFSRTPTPVNIWPKLQIFRFSLYQFLTGFLLVTTPMVVTVSSGDECSNYQSVPCELPQAQGGVRHADGGQHHTGVEDKTLSSTASFCAFVDTRPYWLRHYVASVEIWQIYSLMILCFSFPWPSQETTNFWIY